MLEQSLSEPCPDRGVRSGSGSGGRLRWRCHPAVTAHWRCLACWCHGRPQRRSVRGRRAGADACMLPADRELNCARSPESASVLLLVAACSTGLFHAPKPSRFRQIARQLQPAQSTVHNEKHNFDTTVLQVVAYSKRKRREDHAPSEPLHRPPYHRRRCGASLGHLEHWVSGVWAVVQYPGVGRYESVKPRLKLDP
eukprot:COSAG06_NODE_894_length_11709_cov_6.062010_8_plen_196_part_00